MIKPLLKCQFVRRLVLRQMFTNSKFGLLTGVFLLVIGLNTPVAAADFYRNIVTLTSYGNVASYYAKNDGSTLYQSFQNQSFGSFDRGGSFQIGGEANITDDTGGGGSIQPPQLFYRVYRKDSIPGVFVPIRLSFITNNNDQPDGKKWGNPAPNINLLNAANSGNGRYILEVYFAYNTISNTGSTSSPDGSDGSKLAPYTASFDVTGTSPTQWTGQSSTVWSDAGNWLPAVVPGLSTDVIIPYNSSVNRPVIAAGNTGRARTLLIAGNLGAPATYNGLSLTGGELQLSGDFQDPGGTLDHTGGVVALVGNSAQTFDGGVFFDLRIDGGTTKTLSGRASILNSLMFTQSGGIIQTRTDDPGNYNIDLGTKAQIINESELGYVLGILRSTDRIVDQDQNSFGNIGLDLTIANAAPVKTSVIRNTSFAYNGAGTSKNIRRSFSLQPDNLSNLSYSITFHYLNAELNGTQKANLLLLRAPNGSTFFQPLSVSSASENTKTLTRLDITGTIAATFTLGDVTNPLPVTLTSFAAVAQGPDALLTWTTAQELNNAGFEVQVSADGTTFGKLGFVAAASPNSTEARAYQFRDATAGKQGTRYYRLRQLDVDGKASVFAPQSLAFGGAAAASVQGFPNPFASEITLALQTVAAGPAAVSVLDGVGRQVRSWRPTLAAGASSLVLSDLAGLPRGLYVVQVRYPDGQTQRLKVVKE